MTSHRCAEAALEDLAEALEELDVLGLLAGELQQRARAPVVVRERAAARGPARTAG